MSKMLCTTPFLSEGNAVNTSHFSNAYKHIHRQLLSGYTSHSYYTKHVSYSLLFSNLMNIYERRKCDMWHESWPHIFNPFESNNTISTKKKNEKTAFVRYFTWNTRSFFLKKRSLGVECQNKLPLFIIQRRKNTCTPSTEFKRICIVDAVKYHLIPKSNCVNWVNVNAKEIGHVIHLNHIHHQSMKKLDLK